MTLNQCLPLFVLSEEVGTKDFKTFDYKFSNRHFCQIQTKLLQEAACKKLLLALGKCYAWAIHVKDIICWAPHVVHKTLSLEG